MEVVKAFNDELSSLYDTKPPISKAKMTSITRTAIKAIKFYKHVVQSVEKFIQKCKPEYKVPGLYVIDSIVRQSRHQFGTEKDVFAPRFARNLKTTFGHLFNCPSEDKSKVIRVLNLWQKNNVFESDVIQPLFDLADPTHPIHKEGSTSNGLTTKNTSSSNSTSLTRTPTSVKPQVKSDSTPSWLGNLTTETPNSSVLLGSSSAATTNKQTPLVDSNMLQQLQQLQSILLNQTPIDSTPAKKDSNSDQVKFDKKLLDFDYGDEEDEDGKTSPAQAAQQQQQQSLPSAIDSLGSILCNPEVLRQLQNLQLHMSQQQQLRQQQNDMEEKMRKLQEMKQQEEEFDKHLAQTLPSLPFANECDFKLNTDTNSNLANQALLQQQAQLAGFKGVDVTQPPPGYPQMNQTSPLEDGERANSDVDERHAGIRNWVSDAMMRSQNLNRQQGNDSNAQVVVIDSESPSESPRQKKSRSRFSRSSSRSRSKRRSRSRSHSRSRSKRRRSRSYDRDRDYDKDWEKSSRKETDKEKERERRKKGLPPLKKHHLAVCSTTLWIGHLSKLVQQEELSDTFGEYGDIVSIDLIPPRGCAFICMNRRQDAHRALQQLKYHKLQGKAITLAWAPGKGMKGKEWKDYWEVDQGVSYIPWSKINAHTDLELLEEGGMFDEESFPDWLRKKIESEKLKPKRVSEKLQDNSSDKQQQQQLNKNQNSTSDESDSKKQEDGKDEKRKEPELDIPIPAPTLPGYIPLPDGPQPDLKVTPQPTAMPPMGLPPMGMMPPFGLPNVPRLMGPMGMPMGPGLMPNVNVPLGVPPPGLMGSPLMHQQMMQRMPQPVNSPFNPPRVSLMGGPPPPLSQIPLPGGPGTPDKTKPGMPPIGVPPPTTDISGFTDPLLQMPFSLPPQLQLNKQSQQLSIKTTEAMDLNDSDKNKKPDSSNPESVLNNPFTHPPPNFTSLSALQGLHLVPPPTSTGAVIVPTSLAAALAATTNNIIKDENQDSEEKDKDERENKDKDFREKRDFHDNRGGPDKERDRDRDYRNRNRDRDYRADRDYRGDKDYRNRNDKVDKDYRERGDKDYRERDRDYRGDKDYRDRRDVRKDRNSRERDEKPDEDMRSTKDGKESEEDRKSNDAKSEEKNDRESRRDRDKDRNRERSRERDRSRERERDRDRHRNRNSRWGDRDNSNKRKDEMGRTGDDKPGSGLPDRSPWAHDRSDQTQDNNRDQFNNEGPRSLLDLPQIPPPDVSGPGLQPGSGPGQGPGPGPGGLCPPRGPPGPMGPMGMVMPDGPPPFLGPRGPSPGGPLMFGPRGPPPQDGFGMLDRDGRHRLEANPEDFEMMLLHGDEGPPGFGRGLPPRGMPPPNNRGPPDMFEPLGPPPMEGFGPPRFEPRGPEGFEPRIRIEFFPRGRGLIRPDNFGPRMMGRGPMGPMFSPRGPGGPGPIGMRGPRPGIWDEGQGGPPPRVGPGFPPPRGFPPPDVPPEEFSQQRPRGGGIITRGPMRGRFPGRADRRGSRWSSASPPPEDLAADQQKVGDSSPPSSNEVNPTPELALTVESSTVPEPMETSSQGEFTSDPSEAAATPFSETIQNNPSHDEQSVHQPSSELESEVPKSSSEFQPSSEPEPSSEIERPSYVESTAPPADSSAFQQHSPSESLSAFEQSLTSVDSSMLTEYPPSMTPFSTGPTIQTDSENIFKRDEPVTQLSDPITPEPSVFAGPPPNETVLENVPSGGEPLIDRFCLGSAEPDSASENNVEPSSKCIDMFAETFECNNDVPISNLSDNVVNEPIGNTEFNETLENNDKAMSLSVSEQPSEIE